MELIVKLLILSMEKLGRDLNCVCMVELACLTLGFARCPLLDLRACSQRWEALGSTQKVQPVALSSKMWHGQWLLSSQPAWEVTIHCLASSSCLFPARTPGGNGAVGWGWAAITHSSPGVRWERFYVGKHQELPHFSPETRAWLCSFCLCAQFWRVSVSWSGCRLWSHTKVASADDCCVPVSQCHLCTHMITGQIECFLKWNLGGTAMVCKYHSGQAHHITKYLLKLWRAKMSWVMTLKCFGQKLGTSCRGETHPLALCAQGCDGSCRIGCLGGFSESVF